MINYLTDFSSLQDVCISEKYYWHVFDVWNMLKRKTMGDYHDLYLKEDDLLLAVFEIFIHTCLEYYELDPSHYLNSPGLS